MSELESLGREWCGCLSHDLHTTGVCGWLAVIADENARGGAEVVGVSGGEARVWASEQLMHAQMALLQFGELDRRSLWLLECARMQGLWQALLQLLLLPELLCQCSQLPLS